MEANSFTAFSTWTANRTKVLIGYPFGRTWEGAALSGDAAAKMGSKLALQAQMIKREVVFWQGIGEAGIIPAEARQCQEASSEVRTLKLKLKLEWAILIPTMRL